MIWGGYHGMLLASERFFRQYITIPPNIFWNIFKIISIFSLVTLGWLFFKLPNFFQAIEYLSLYFLIKVY